MRKITEIIIHCSATREGHNFTVGDIDRWHRARGFNGVGYHYIVYLDGTIVPGRSEAQIGAHCLSHNAGSIGICYIGGLDSAGKPKDTRTPEQRRALRRLTGELLKRYPEAKLHGHREFAPKACPCFDVASEVMRGLLPAVVILILLLASSCRSQRMVQQEFSESSESSEISECSESSNSTTLLTLGADSIRRVVEYRDTGTRRVTVSIYAPRLIRSDTVARQAAARREQGAVETRQEALAGETRSESPGTSMLPGLLIGFLASVALAGAVRVIRNR